jgi:hypothetical protein
MSLCNHHKPEHKPLNIEECQNGTARKVSYQKYVHHILMNIRQPDNSRNIINTEDDNTPRVPKLPVSNYQ